MSIYTGPLKHSLFKKNGNFILFFSFKIMNIMNIGNRPINVYSCTEEERWLFTSNGDEF